MNLEPEPFTFLPDSHGMRDLFLHATVFVILLWAGASPPPLSGQSVSVLLESVGGGEGPVVERFRDALGSLDETEVVAPSELAEYVISVSTLCVPDSEDCASADAFAVSVVLSEPLSAGGLKSGLSRTGDRTLSEWRASPEAEAFFQRYRQMHAVWTTRWGADRVAERVGRLVRGIDARCFDKRRTLERQARLRARDDTAQAEVYLHDLDVDGSWLC